MAENKHTKKHNKRLRNLAEEELQRQLTQDSLTGLPNRALLIDRLEQTIAHSKRDNTQFCVFIIDLELDLLSRRHFDDGGRELMVLDGDGALDASGGPGPARRQKHDRANG